MLSLAHAEDLDAGDYTVQVYNETGAVLSEPARLTVRVPVVPGALDKGFDLERPLGMTAYLVRFVAPLPNGDAVLVGGIYAQETVWQINSQGGYVRTLYTTQDSWYDQVSALAAQTDGKILMASINHHDKYSYIVRMNPDGNRDTSFSSSHISGSINCLASQVDGKVLVGGTFYGWPTSKLGLFRLNADGSPDALKDIMISGVRPQGAMPATSVSVNRLAARPDGRILISASYYDVDGVVRYLLMRAQADGTQDDSFTVGTGANSGVGLLSVDASQRILIGGGFTQVQGVARNQIARLLPDGQLDTSFDPGPGADNSVSCWALQPDGKLWIGGSFTNVDGFPCNGIALLNPDGSRNVDFNPGAGVQGGGITSMALQANSDLLIAGSFTSYNGVPRNGMARIHGFPPPPVVRLSQGRWNAGDFTFQLQGTSGARYALQTSTNLVDWQVWTHAQLSGSSLALTNSVSADDTAPRFYRAVAE